MDARGQAERIRQFWDGYAADYDAEPDHGLRGPGMHRAWRDLLARALPPAPARVADLGCGTGSLTEVVASLGHRVWACDSSAAMVALAGAKVARFADRVTVRQADAADPPLRPRSMDAVVARHVVWTMLDPLAALSNWLRIVRPGGHLVLIEGRWQVHPAASYVGGPALPWDGGVSAADLTDALQGLGVTDLVVTPLVEEVLWGRAVEDERYLVVASVPGGAAHVPEPSA